MPAVRFVESSFSQVEKNVYKPSFEIEESID